jgi:hypothetical protein
MIEPPGYVVRIERTFDAPREAVLDRGRPKNALPFVLGIRALHACGGRWKGRFLSQKPSQNQCTDTPPNVDGF